MSDEEAISISDAESEGEGPNIRPPQAAGGSGFQSKRSHKQKHRDKDMWRQRHRDDRGESKRDRDRRRAPDDGRGRHDRSKRSDRDRERGGGRRGFNEDANDLRHRLKERHLRDFASEERHRSDRHLYEGRDRSRGDRAHPHPPSRSNRFVEADKHKEERKRDVEEARRQRELLEEEMEIIAEKLKKKNKASRERNRKSESEEESGEDSEEEVSDEDISENESGSGSGSDATGSQKSEDTPNREDSSDGEVEDEDNEDAELEAQVRKSKSRSRTPVEGKWADRSSSAERTPSRSPTPMKEEEMEVETKEETEPQEDHRGPFSVPGSPAGLAATGLNSPAKDPPAPVPAVPALPPYLPSVHGCRSVIEFSCLNRIEEGTYGVVYRARDKKTQEIVALKKLKMEKEKEGFPITSLREINTLLISQHPNVVPVREIVVGNMLDQIYIVMDFLEHDLKSLMETMRKKKQVFLPGEVKCLMVQLLKAIHHLHDNWILHRDLKSSNLLLSHNGILKVGDFGLAREYGSPLKAYTSIVVTLWYRAPELLLGMKQYSTHIDVWSIGCIFGELLLMEPLFPGKSETDELNKIFKLLGTPSERSWSGFSALPNAKVKFVDYPVSHLRDKFPERMLSQTGLELLKNLLTYDPKKRINCEEALSSSYFSEAPLPIDPSMFPTWPAKSEQDAQDKLKKGNSPKAPSGGHAFKKMQGGDDDDERAMRLYSNDMDNPLKFSKEDVRTHLAELGYSNIEGNQLDEFCEDLKRLIKYEEKKQNIGRKLDQLDQMEQNLSANKENEDVTTSKKKRRIRKEDKRRLKEEKLKSKEAKSTSSHDAGIEDDTMTSDKCESSSLYIDVNLPPSRPHSAKYAPLAASLVEQPPPGFIRVRSGPSVGKRPSSSDPVALHQKYQGYWDKFGVPGEKRHDKLRWAVRGWMMGEEPL